MNSQRTTEFAEVQGQTHLRVLSDREPGIFLTPPGDERTQSDWVDFLVAGTELADFKVEKRIAANGRTGVFSAVNRLTGELVALKVIASTHTDAERLASALAHEYRHYARVVDLKHVLRVETPRVAQVRDVPLVVMPMELAADGTVRDWLTRYPSLDERLSKGIDLFKQACEGVSALHVAEIYHMDLKPEQLLLTGNLLKVADLGISRCLCRSQDASDAGAREGAGGTVAYASPERLAVTPAKGLSAASDIYSLGVVLYEILTGSLPFTGTDREIQMQHLRCSPPELKGAARRWWRVVQRCLQKNPGDRFGSVEQLLEEVNRVERAADPDADVSCRVCGGVNSEEDGAIWSGTCARCGQRLPDDLFRTCPNCKTRVRRDLAACACGQDVARYYRSKELKDGFEAAKDEDPELALSFLRRMLSEPDRDEQAIISSMREMNDKERQVAALQNEAGRLSARCELEEATKAWQSVLSILPRHRPALEEASLLTRRLSEEASALQRATYAMDHGHFTDAEKYLGDTLKALPGRLPPAHLLAACRERAATYSAALPAARKSQERRALQEAAARIREALVAAPASEDGLRLQREVGKALAQQDRLAAKAQAHMDATEFPQAEAAIASLRSSQTDSSRAAELTERLELVRAGYDKAIAQAVDAQKRRDLHSAAAKVDEALQLCPHARPATSLRDSIRAEMQHATDLVEQARHRVPLACFPEAERRLKEAAAVWPSVPHITEVTEAFTSSRPRYEAARGSAERAAQEKDLGAAVTFIESALRICPQSGEMLKLMSKVRQDQEEVGRLSEVGEAALRRADFGAARQQWLLAHALWPKNERTCALGRSVESAPAGYLQQLWVARIVRLWNCTKAEAACRRALGLCPKAPGVVSLLQSIIVQRRGRDRRREKALIWAKCILPYLAAVAILVNMICWGWPVVRRHFGSAVNRAKSISVTPAQASAGTDTESAAKPEPPPPQSVRYYRPSPPRTPKRPVRHWNGMGKNPNLDQ